VPSNTCHSPSHDITPSPVAPFFLSLHDSDFPFPSHRVFFFISPSTPSNQSCHIALTTARATIAPFYPPCLIQHEQKNRYVGPQPTLRPILEISKLNMVTIFPSFFPFLSLPIPQTTPTFHHPLTPRRLPTVSMRVSTWCVCSIGRVQC
jgi:hypothetical protein